MDNGWTKRIEELTESRDHWKREWSLLNAGLNMAEDRIKELAAENKRLVALNDTFPQEIARLEDRVSEEYEAERADDRAKIEELKKENRRLRELVDGATVAVELFKDTAPAQKKWREEWLNKAREALKEARYG